ncbi:MAG: DEAD/DEAH box helicase [Phycisphaerales bacterium]|nr:DEAD/DEAH box helicase [Phycisphaerales bacterium]
MDRSDVCTRFLDALVFDLYPFQEEALLAWFESDGGLLVSAPTGMGKTLIAEAALFEALHGGQRLYYTTPLIALTDQKFREFQDLAERWGFARDDVGLITGNRKINPEARIRVVVAEILLNHLLAADQRFDDVAAVVMDEFHYFNDLERGIVWELSLVMLPPHVRLMLLSATVGNAADFIRWLSEQHGRKVRLIQTQERRIPLEFNWVGDKLLTEHLPTMVSDNDGENRAPALVFCFNRDQCWEVAERLKGLPLITAATRGQIEERINADDFKLGIGPKLRQMLIRGVGVHHAGVLPKHKIIVETLFLEKLIPFVVCTETLAAGINLPARSVVLSTLVKGKRGEEKLIAPSAAHQMFGRAGRPQFDTHGYVYVLAHDDDVKIEKWRRKYEQIDPHSKDLGILRARKDLERKRPSRRKTETYWTQGQFESLIKAGPAKLASRSMIPYQVLVFLLSRTGRLADIRQSLSKRFNTPDRIAGYQQQLEHMIDNLATFGHVTRADDGDHVVVNESVFKLLTFRSVDPLYGAFLAGQLVFSNFEEKLQVLESVLPMPPALERRVDLPDIEPGPLQLNVLQPRLLQMGLLVNDEESGQLVAPEADHEVDHWAAGPRRTLSLPEMLKALFDARLKSPEELLIRPKWIAGGVNDHDGDFYRYVTNRDLTKDEGLILRHLLRLTILCGEFATFSGGDPDYRTIADRTTKVCTQVDPRYTDRFLTAEQQAPDLLDIRAS